VSTTERRTTIAINWFYPFRQRVYISSRFGPRASPGGIGSTNHLGLDFAPSGGTPIYAVAAGTVVKSGNVGGFGNRVVIDHGEGWTSLYGHMQSASPLREGQAVGAGTYVGPVGTTGNSTGNHLHLQLELNGTAHDPAPLVEGAALAPATPVFPGGSTTPTKKAPKNMLLISSTQNLDGAAAGYVAVVGVRTLRHVTTIEQLDALRTAGLELKQLTRDQFYNVINGLSIPRAAISDNADYAR
jgi:murein DD-endopeptidase MepM/ murein hydrolase activator NlpD